MFEIGLTPHITIPTKVNIENAITRFSVLDQIWSPHSLSIKRAFVIPVDITDHYPVGVFTDVHHDDFKANTIKKRSLRESSKQLFAMFLSNIELTFIPGNFNESFNHYYNKLFQIYDIAFPVTVSSIKCKKIIPWMTAELRQCVRKKSKLYKLFLKGSIRKTDYTSYKNRLTNVLRRAKRLYFTKMFSKVCKNSGKTWSCINSILEKKMNVTLEKINVDGIALSGLDLVNYANNYFATAAARVTSGLSLVHVYPFLTPPVRLSCFFYPSDRNEVMRVIGNLKNKGNKLFDISPVVLKENSLLFSTHISSLYNFSLIERVFPMLMKIARIIAIHKSGLESIIDNYRPISILPVVSKIFERLTLDRMMNFITAHDILTFCQFGFRRGKNTTHAVIKLMSHILPAYQNKIYSACFFLDLRKAFDTVNHRLLLEKLEHYGFRGLCHDYLKSYFKNRKQYVQIDGQKSDLMPVTIGVPQGSILGPLCFSLFINDMPQAVDAYTVLFADDAAFIVTSTTLSELFVKIKKLFDDLERYLNANILVPNSSKSKLMMFSSRPTQDLPNLRFAGAVIEWVKEYKYLGLTLTNNLSFGKHIKNMALNISRVTGTLTSLTNFLPIRVLLKLYSALALPYLTNHLIVWGAAPVSQMRVLNVRVNRMLRLILRVPYVDGRPTMSNNELYRFLDILNLDNLFRYNLFKFLKLMLDGKAPEFYDILLRPHLSSHTYQTRGMFRHPYVNCEVVRRALSHQLILLYDEIPYDILNANLSLSFRRFKSFLLEN